MVDFNINAALDGLKALIETMPSVEAVQIGAPEDPPRVITVWLTLGDPGDIKPYAGGIYELPIMLIVWIGYDVAGSEQAAEAQVADIISDLTRRIIRNRFEAVDGIVRNFNGTVDLIGLPQSAAGIADYTEMSGREIRVYPLGVRVTQRWNYGS